MTTTAEETVVYTDAQIGEINKKIRYWHSVGDPGKALALRGRLKAGEMIEPGEYTGDVIFPEKSTQGADPSHLILPGRIGPGSKTDQWRNFANATADIEPAVVEKMNRADIIAILEEKGIIPKEEDE